MHDLISVIVPVYKVENYLDRCVQSIVEQTYDNLEIILVDDGSPDQCPKMCDDWAAKDQRIKVIHKKNGGLSDARNVGIAESNGKYLTFIDSDDYVDSRFIECLYTQIQKNGAQMSCVGIQMFDDKSRVNIDTEQHGMEIYTRKGAIEALFDSSKFRDYAWNKMFERSLFNTTTFPKGRLTEDRAILFQLIGKCNCISYCPIKVYFYYQRENSCLHNPNKKLTQDWYWSSKERYIYTKDHYPEFALNYKYFNYIILQCYSALDNKEKKYAKQEFRKNLKYGLPTLTKNGVLEITIFMINEKLYCKVWEWWHR